MVKSCGNNGHFVFSLMKKALGGDANTARWL